MHIYNNQPIQSEGCLQKFLLQLLSLDVSRPLVHSLEQKRAHVYMIHRVKVLSTTNSLALQVFNTVDHVFFTRVFEPKIRLRILALS